MLEISMEKDPALTLLYSLLTAASTLLCVCHYWYGHFDMLLINLIAMAIFAFAAIFSSLNRHQYDSKYINLLTLCVIAILMQYPLHEQPQLTLHWIYIFPMLASFILPLPWASALTLAVLASSLAQLTLIYDGQPCLRLGLIYTLIGLCSLCYAYLNASKQQRLLALAVTDYQSGAYNRRFLSRMLEQEISRSQFTQRTLSLLALSIDDYQQVLDIHGHGSGVKLLREFRVTLIEQLRAGDEVFHDGEGTFYILLPNCPSEGVVLLKERLKVQLDERQWVDVGELQLSVGLATLREAEDSEHFFQRASEQVVKQQQTALRLLAFDH
ncbi:MAG: GGDEF domain-containing protein [Bermanella sp.]